MFTAAGFPRVVPVVKNSPANEGDARGAGSIPGSERSPRVRNDNPVFLSRKFHGQRSLEDYHGTSKSQT